MLCLVDVLYSYFFFFFKQKTAYEMRISDWSSDVCSSDLSIDRCGPDGIVRFSLRAHPGLQRGQLITGDGYRPADSGDPAITRIERYCPDIGRKEIGIDAGHKGKGGGSGADQARSEERREGNECVSPCRSRWSPDN